MVQTKWYNVVQGATRCCKHSGIMWYKVVQGATRCYKVVQTKWYKVVQGGARWYQVVQGGARWYKVLQGDTRSCKVAQGGANEVVQRIGVYTLQTVDKGAAPNRGGVRFVNSHTCGPPGNIHLLCDSAVCIWGSFSPRVQFYRMVLLPVGIQSCGRI